MSEIGPKPLLLSVPEAASILGVGKTTLWDLIHSKRLPSMRINSRVLIHRDALEAFAAQALPLPIESSSTRVNTRTPGTTPRGRR